MNRNLSCAMAIVVGLLTGFGAMADTITGPWRRTLQEAAFV